MALLALGVVYGDIGTSPLYTFKECLAHAAADGGVDERSVFEIVSLIFWSLTMVVTLKYVAFILRADNKGQGGIFALLALLPQRLRGGPLLPLTVTSLLVVIGAALLYGDGAITPAISVLSAVEGLAIANPAFTKWVLPLTITILIGLFLLQSKGTRLIGQLFGPVMVVWFATLAVLGVVHIALEPRILQALSPHYAVGYFVDHGVHGVLLLGAVVLCVTGGEALYADMGHFGRRPVSRAWLLFVMPALALNYFGQGSLMLRDPTAQTNPFFAMVPAGGPTYALVGLASLATVIASQALISGAFSLTRQAMQLGLFPRVTVRHTDKEQEGQIYIPEVNTFLAVACICLVVTFKESTRLAAAYGIAVTGTMAITSVVFFLVLRTRGWPLWKAGAVLALFLSFDLPFLAANLWKFTEGGYVPVLLGVVIVIVMVVWHRGRVLISERYTARFSSFEDTWPQLAQFIAQRTPGTGVFMAASDKGVPPILVHHVRRTRALHKQVLLLTVITAEVPAVELKDRISIEPLGHGFFRVRVYFGFMQEPELPRALRLALVREELEFDPDDVTFYLAREHVLSGAGGEMGPVTEKLFGYLQRNAANVDRYFQIPPEQVVEVGTQIDL